MNTDFQTKHQRFLKCLMDNLGNIKITGTLERFDELEFKQFLAELKKQKIALSLKQQDEWEEYFSEYKAVCTNLASQIQTTDKEIDNMVYGLYGLTVNEVDKEEFRKQITKFIQLLSYGICINGLSNLMFAVGSQGLDELYDTVTEKVDTPVAKIITFAIKSYYGKIDIRNLEVLFKDVENNHIAKSVLRFYVKKHLYTNHIERTKKEKIIQIAGFKPIIPTHKRLN